MNEMMPPTAHGTSEDHRAATYEDGVAFYLPGPGSGPGISPQPELTPSNFSSRDQINRCPHFAGGTDESPCAPLDGQIQC